MMKKEDEAKILVNKKRTKRTRENTEKHESLAIDHDDIMHQLQSLPLSNNIPNRDLCPPMYDQSHMSYTRQSHKMEEGQKHGWVHSHHPNPNQARGHLFRAPPYYHYQTRYSTQVIPPNPQSSYHHSMNMPFLGGCGNPVCFATYGSHHPHSHSNLEHHNCYRPYQGNYDHRYSPHPRQSCCNFCDCGFPRSHLQMGEQNNFSNHDSYHHHRYQSEPSWSTHPNPIEPLPFHIHTHHTHKRQHSFNSMVTPSQQHNKNDDGDDDDDDVKQNDSVSKECENNNNTQKKKKQRREGKRSSSLLDQYLKENDAKQGGEKVNYSGDNPFLSILFNEF